jgi:hypothetical protein
MKTNAGAALLLVCAALCAGCAGLLGLDDEKFQGGGAGAGGSGGTTSSACEDGPHSDLVSDDFEAAPCDKPLAALNARGWHSARNEEDYPVNTPYAGINLQNGKLLLSFEKTLYWFNGLKGELIYKEIKGDFLIVTDVQVSDKEGDFPTDSGAGAGIMVRKPVNPAMEANGQRWLAFHLGVDAGYPNMPTRYATWTYPDMSNPEIEPFGEASMLPEGQIALCRKGGVFSLWHQIAGGEWVEWMKTPPASWDEAAMPDAVQVGLFAYSYNGADPSPNGVLAGFRNVWQYVPDPNCNPDTAAPER